MGYRYRGDDPESSQEAAASLSVGHVTKLQHVILKSLRVAQRDDFAIRIYCQSVGLIDASESSMRTRRKELCDRGLVRWTGNWNITASMRRTRVWDITQAGLDLLAYHERNGDS